MMPATRTHPQLPPVFRLAVIDGGRGAFTHAVQSIQRGENDIDGHVVWSDRADRLDVAFVVEPEPDDDPDDVRRVLTVALVDALGTQLPATVPLQLRPPAMLVLDGSALVEIRMQVLGQVVVLGVDLPVHESEGQMSLFEVGAGDLVTAALAEALARHFLSWVARFQEDGMAPVQASWNARVVA